MPDHRIYEELEIDTVAPPNDVTLTDPVPDEHFAKIWRHDDGEGMWVVADVDEEDRRHVHAMDSIEDAEFLKVVAVPARDD
jgi:hypothetical protein